VPFDAVRMRGHVFREGPDGALGVAPAQPVRSDLQRRAAEAELRTRAVQLAQEQLAFLETAAPEAGDAQRVQRRQVMRIVLRGRAQHVDGAGEPALLDQDLPQLDARAAVVGVHRDLAGEAGGPAQVAQRARQAAEESKRIPVRHRVTEEQQGRGGQRIAGDPPQERELHPPRHSGTVAASAMWAATGPGPTRAYSGLMAATTPVVMAGT